MKRLIQICVIILIAAFFAGCGPSNVTVGARLDAPYYERPMRPGANYVWIDGDWYVQNGRYVYRNGYWARPRRGQIWITGSWTQRDGGWYWRKGRWGRR